METIVKIIQLCFVHSVCDAALQTEWMGNNKGRTTNKTHIDYKWVLLCHAMVNGCGVWLLTQNVWLGVAETVAHFCIDKCSTERWINFRCDQGLHLVSKMLWGIIW